ncbi:ComEC/Rec2 family competence protein, partial [Clostridium saudiense]|nr:ComEC/Rec2 family competence protein [Clostridium saudiense]
DSDNLKVGDKVVAIGEFNKSLDLSKGIIGEYKVKNYKLLKKDFIGYLYDRRESLYESIKSRLGKRKAGFITSVAFGYSEALDNEDREEMNIFGISHAISVSGLHMALVYGILRRIFGCKISLFIALLYVLFTGASSSTVRSYIMIFIMSFALVVKRNYNPLASISLAGTILLLLHPYDLFSLGFELSFIATLGIIIFNKKLNKKLYKLPKRIREEVAVSI